MDARLTCIRLLVLFAAGSVAGCLSRAAVESPSLRVATFNVSLHRDAPGQLAAELGGRDNAQARKIAAILQRVRPDIVLLNEVDFDAEGAAARALHDNYLAVPQQGMEPLRYPYSYIPAVNTGVTLNTATEARYDFDHDGIKAHAVPPPGANFAALQRYGGDCLGFGAFPGQYGFVIFSRYPIRQDAIRTFQRFLWRDMPGAVLPPEWYSTSDLEVFRLSSKNHVDVPVEVAPGIVFHLLASHPTPPVYDGPEDRNGRRNHDEIRLWADYIRGAGYLYDDRQRRGGLEPRARFIIAGDLNADPFDGDSYRGAAKLLVEHPLIEPAPVPASAGGVEQAQRQGGANERHAGDPANDTGDFGDRLPRQPGNLRIDYVLPSRSGWRVLGSGVFWPKSGEPEFAWIEASDHRLVYIDVQGIPVDAR